MDWRQFWRVAARESDFPELLESPWTSQNFPEIPWKFLGDFSRTSLTVHF